MLDEDEHTMGCHLAEDVVSRLTNGHGWLMTADVASPQAPPSDSHSLCANKDNIYITKLWHRNWIWIRLWLCITTQISWWEMYERIHAYLPHKCVFCWYNVVWNGNGQHSIHDSMEPYMKVLCIIT